MSNMHQIDVMTLTSKYDTNELELRGGEYRNGFTVKNGAIEYIGGPPTPLFLLLWHMGRGRVLCSLTSNFESLAVFVWRPSILACGTLHDFFVRVTIALIRPPCLHPLIDADDRQWRPTMAMTILSAYVSIVAAMVVSRGGNFAHLKKLSKQLQ